MKNIRMILVMGFLVFSSVALTGCKNTSDVSLEEKQYEIEFNESEEVIEGFEEELNFLLDEEGNIDTQLDEIEILELEKIEAEIEALEDEANALFEEEQAIDAALDDLESLDF